MAVTPYQPPPKPRPESRATASRAEARAVERERRALAPPLSEHRRRKLAGRSALAALLILAAATGSLAGLTLVYSVDLPQIQELEQYRPSTTTDLYDRKGRIIGSFALQHREIVGYNDFAPFCAKP